MLQGKIRYYKQQISFSSIHVQLNTTVPGRRVPDSPFYWIESLAQDMHRKGNKYYRESRPWFFKIKGELPKNFVMYKQDQHTTRAISGDAVHVYVRRFDNPKEGKLTFWKKSIINNLQERAVISKISSSDLDLNNGEKAVLIEGQRRLGTKDMGYMLMVVNSRKRVLVYEAWGEKDKFEKVKEEIKASMKTFKAKAFLDLS